MYILCYVYIYHVLYVKLPLFYHLRQLCVMHRHLSCVHAIRNVHHLTYGCVDISHVTHVNKALMCVT